MVTIGRCTPDEVVAVADGAAVRLDPTTRAAVAAMHERAQAVRGPVYGRTTGVGANRSVGAVPDDEHASGLLRSHAVDAGEVLPGRVVRAMLVVRANQLCAGGSGIEPAVLDGLVRMLDSDALPQVRRLGSVGTGDLAALAGVGLALLGERPTTRPFTPLPRLGAASALALMSSSALTVGRACLLLDEARHLATAGEQVTALSAVALRGSAQAWSPRAAAATGVPGVVEAAARLRGLAGPDLHDPARLQDPYGLRVAAIVLGGLREALTATAARVATLVGVAQENPLFVPDEEARTASADDEPPTVHAVHHGAFYQADLAQRLDALRLALAHVAPLGLARLSAVLGSGERPFLAVGRPGSSGLMMLEYVAADAAHTVRLAAAPASLGAAVLSAGVEEHAPFAAHGVDALERALESWRVLLACELVAARRALRLAGRTVRGPLAALAADPDLVEADHDLRSTLDRAVAAVGTVTACTVDR